MRIGTFRSFLLIIFLTLHLGCTSGGGSAAGGLPSLEPSPTATPDPTITQTPSPSPTGSPGGNATPSTPTLSYSSATGSTGVVGTLMSISPSTLTSNGANITSCAIKVGTTALPSYFTVSPTTCIIVGTPTSILTATQFTLVATNSVGTSADAFITLTINATVPTLSYSSSTGTMGIVGTGISIVPSTLSPNGANITACGIMNGTTALPNTLTVNTTTCTISGIPSAVLPATVFQLVATNAQGNSEYAVVSIAINATVGGTLSGLNGTLVLQNNSGDNLTLTSNGAFVFSTALVSGASYSVSVLAQPSGQLCTVSNGTGSISSSSITSVSISCITPTWASTIQDGTSGGITIGKSIAVDSTGNTFVTGSTNKAIDGQSLHGTHDFFISKYNVLGARQWTVQNGSSLNTYSRGITTDLSGNVYIVGYVSGSLDSQSYHGSYDLFITKYNTNGVLQWTIQDGVLSGYTYGTSIILDSTNNIYVTGYTTAAIDGQSQHGTSDLFITKYNSSGIHQWTVQDGAASGSVQGFSIAGDSSNNVYVTGNTTVAIDSQVQHGNYDLFMTKYDSTGTLQWTIQKGATGGTTYGFGIASDSNGNIYVTGETNVSLDSQTLHGSFDLFIIKYNSSGTRMWTIQDGASPTVGVTQGQGIATDSAGNVYVAGSTTVAIGSQTQHGTSDFVISKYNSSGTRQWTVQDGAASGTTSANGIAADAFGNIYATGDTNVAIDSQLKHGSDDLFITQYSSAGVHE